MNDKRPKILYIMHDTANTEPAKTEKGNKFHIKIAEGGPYLVFGRPPLVQQFLMPNEEGEIWYFQQGREFPMEGDPTALCRCGASGHKPYCDGAHKSADWDPTLAADESDALSNAELIEGPVLSMSDNESLCVFARFCDAKGRAWNLVQDTDDEPARKALIHETQHCPNSRLTAWDNLTKEACEPELEQEIGLIEDPQINVSGGLRLTGGMLVRKENGIAYQTLNRVVLCRCGQSSNKPYCDGTHASFKFDDGLGGEPDGKKW